MDKFEEDVKRSFEPLDGAEAEKKEYKIRVMGLRSHPTNRRLAAGYYVLNKSV